MQKTNTPSWLNNLASALQQDPKKTGFLSCLIAIFLMVSVRMFFAGNHPQLAAGATFPITSGGGVATLAPAPSIKPNPASASMRGWLSAPIPQLKRNDFLLKSDYYPHDTTATSDAAPTPGFWTAIEKSLSQQADQKVKQQAAIADLKRAAAALRPTSTVIGDAPHAMVNGSLVGVGDTVDSFRVVRIESRGIIVQRDGVQLAIPMN